MSGNANRDPVRDAFEALHTETQGLDTMEPLRTVINRRNVGGGGPSSRWPLLTSAAVILLAVVGIAAWLSRDVGQSVDTDVAADGSNDTTTDDVGAQLPVDLESLAGSTWTLRAGGGPSGDITLVDGYPITLTFEADSFGGTAACNGYGSTYSIDGNRIAIDGIGATEMGCEPAVQASEQAYFAALADVTDITLVGDELVLGGPSTELIFTRLQPAPTEDLVDTIWLLDTIISGETASTVAGDPAPLFIGSDGTFSGGTGCRSFSGRYQTFGSEVQFNEFAAGPEECPSELSDQDNHVFTVLGDGFTAEIDGPRLTVTSAGGDGLGYRSVTEDEVAEALAEITPRPVATDAELLNGVEWVLVAGYGDPDNPDEITIPDPRTVDPDQPITLRFGEGVFAGTVVCNDYGGDVEIGNGSLVIGVVETTEEGCGDGLAAIASDYLDALPLMAEFGLEADGERLVMNGGDIELHFERAE